MNYQVKHIGKHRGNSRLWFESRALDAAGLPKGTRYTIKKSMSGITLTPHPEGERIVSGKEKNGVTTPIIDICSSETLGVLADQPAVKVVYSPNGIEITKLSSVELADARTNRLTKGLKTAVLTAALCFGGGMLDYAAHAGLKDAGVASELAVAVEIDEELIEHAAAHNPVVTASTRIYNTPMQELVQDRDSMAELPAVDLLVAGIPCSGASISGKSKLGLATAEDHPEVGHLVVPYLMLVNQFQPAVAVIECVVPYSQTVSAKLMRTMFRDMGYTTSEVVLNAYDFGSIEDRKRWFLVAATKGITIDLTGLEPALVARPTLGQYLLPANEDRYSEMAGLKAKEVRDKAAGKGFAMQIVTADTTKIGVIGKDYNKNRSTEPKVQHPDDPNRLRLLSPAEHAAIKDFPAQYLGELSATAAHQLLGQGVDVRPARALFRRIGQQLLAWDRGAKTTITALPYNLERATG